MYMQELHKHGGVVMWVILAGRWHGAGASKARMSIIAWPYLGVQLVRMDFSANTRVYM